MPQTRPEVNPKSFVPKKKLGAKTVGFVGASLARGMYGFDTGRSRGLLGFFHGGKRNGRWEGWRMWKTNDYSALSIIKKGYG